MSPQLENGYTRIANELLDALISRRVPGVIMQVFLAIIRNTYGYNSKKRAISLSTIQSATGILPSNICAARLLLIEAKMITVEEQGGKASPIYQVNKEYKEWTLPRNPNHHEEVQIIKDNNELVIKDNNENEKSLLPLIKPVIISNNPLIISNNALLVKDTFKDNIKTCALSKKNLTQFFDTLWERYPKKLGKADARKHFLKNIKTIEDVEKITRALENFLKSKHGARKDDVQYVQHGSRWFNHSWEDWINDPISEPDESEKYIIRN